MPRLSTHVLDTARGMPAAGVVTELHRLRAGERLLVATGVTGSDGRIDALLSGDRFDSGIYELVFQAGAYFRQSGLTLPALPFLDEVVIRIGLADSTGNYHVPLLLSPYGYSTYKGS